MLIIHTIHFTPIRLGDVSAAFFFAITNTLIPLIQAILIKNQLNNLFQKFTFAKLKCIFLKHSSGCKLASLKFLICYIHQFMKNGQNVVLKESFHFVADKFSWLHTRAKQPLRENTFRFNFMRINIKSCLNMFIVYWTQVCTSAI